MTVHEINVTHNLGMGQKITKVDDSQLTNVTHDLNLEHTIKVEAYWSPTFIPLPPHHTRWTDHVVADIRNGQQLTFGMLCGDYTTSCRQDVYNFDPNVLPADPPYGSAPYDHRKELPQFFPSQTIYQYLPTNYFTEYHWWLNQLCELYGWVVSDFTLQGQPGEFNTLTPVSCFYPQRLLSGDLIPDVGPGNGPDNRDPLTGVAYQTVMRPLSEFELLGWYSHHKAYLGQLMQRLHTIFVDKFKFVHPTTSAMFNIFNTNIRMYLGSTGPVESVTEQCFNMRTAPDVRASTGWWTPRLDGVGEHGKLSRHDYVRLLPKRMMILSYADGSTLQDASNGGNALLNDSKSCSVRGFSFEENFQSGEGWYEIDGVLLSYPWPVVPVTDPNVWHFPSIYKMAQFAYFDEFRTVVVTQAASGPNPVSNESSWYPVDDYHEGGLVSALGETGYTGDCFREWQVVRYPGRLNYRTTQENYAAKEIYFGTLEEGNLKEMYGTNVAGDQIVSVQTRQSTISSSPNGTHVPHPGVKLPESLDFGPCFDTSSCPTYNSGNVGFRRTQTILGGSGGFKQYEIFFQYNIQHIRPGGTATISASVSYQKPLGCYNFWALNGRTFREAFGVFPAVNTVKIRENGQFTYRDDVNMRIISERNPFIGYKVIAFCSSMTLHSTGQQVLSESTQIFNGVENNPSGWTSELKAKKLYEGAIAGTTIFEKSFSYSEYSPFMTGGTFASTSQRDMEIDISSLYELFDTQCNSFCIALVPIFSPESPDWTFHDMIKEGAEDGAGYLSLNPSSTTVDTFMTSTLQAGEAIGISINAIAQGELSTVPGGHKNPLIEDARRYRYYCEVGPFRIPCLMPMYKVSN